MLKRGMRKAIIITACVAVVLAILFGACAVYLGDYYRADTASIEAFAPMDDAEISVLDDGSLVFSPKEEVHAGLIFYPGGKVEHTAYQPLMAALAAEGILCVLVEMPFRLAVLDVNAADGIQERYPEVSRWYIGGHSLGGSMAASYLSEHTESYEGLLLLGSYSTADLSESGLDVLSVYGSEDLVLNRQKYEESRTNLPSDTVEIVIDGGCHAQFGMYGAQAGDGTPMISAEEQIALTAEYIVAHVEEG